MSGSCSCGSHAPWTTGAQSRLLIRLGDTKSTARERVLADRVRAVQVPRAVAGQTVLFATGTFGSSDRARRADSIGMLARILSRFSLVSLVELRRDTTDLERVLVCLGPSWRALYSEPLDDPGSNEERACFLFDTRFVRQLVVHVGKRGARRAEQEEERGASNEGLEVACEHRGKERVDSVRTTPRMARLPPQSRQRWRDSSQAGSM